MDRKRALYNRGSEMKKIQTVSSTQKSPLKVGAASVRPILRMGGIEAHNMEAGNYRVNCTGAGADEKGRPILTFRVLDEPHTGTALRKWLAIHHTNGEIRPGTPYAKLCALALGRDPEPDDILEPSEIFRGKNFLAFVGWRMTEKPRGGTASSDLALRRKDDRDFLRVHELLQLLDAV